MRGRRSFTLALVTAFAVVLPMAAAAHPPAAYVPAIWNVFPLRTPGTAPAVPWTRAPSLQAEGGDVLQLAAQPWNEVGAAFAFADRGADPLEPGRDTCNPTVPAPVGRGEIDGDQGILAVTGVCSIGGQAFYFEMIYDEVEPWWFGEADAVPPGRFDFVSIMTHEFGHATGFAEHFLPGQDPECADPLDHHTMCAAINPGHSLPRTLEAHDTHTFAGAYE